MSRIVWKCTRCGAEYDGSDEESWGWGCSDGEPTCAFHRCADLPKNDLREAVKVVKDEDK